MYSGEGLVIVPDGFNVEDRWYSSSYNLDQYIINYPSDAAIRKGLASYYDGQWHRGESSRRPLYTEDWTYTYDAITLNVGNTSVGYDYETINYGNTHHIDMHISYDDRENVGIAYQVVQPDGTVFYRTSTHKLGENVNINNTVSTSEDFNTDGYTYKSIIEYNGVDYKFDGWYSDENYQTKAENSITASEMRTFYAKYIPAEDKVTINYKSTDTSMGTVTVGSETILSKTGQANGSVATPNTGYTFVGWYDNENCNGKPISTDENLIPKKPGSEWESVTYYAKFEEKEGLVRYNLTGGTWTSEWQTDDNGFYIYPGHYLYPDTFTVTDNLPIRKGYVFIGWLDKERESHSAGESEAAIRNARDVVTFIYDNESEDKVYTLDAVWAKIESTPKTEMYNGTNIFIDPVEELTYYTSDEYEGQLVDDLGIELKNVKYQLIKINEVDVSEANAPSVATPSQKNVSVYTYKITGDVYIDGENEGEVSTTTTLTITPRTVTLQSANLSKPYDGEPLVNGDTALAVETGWAEGEGATYTFTGSQTLVGNSANAFTYNPKSNTDLSNYTIQKTEGQLTVTSREAKYEVTVKANSGSKTYDGKELRVSGFKNEVADKGIKVEAENGKTYYVTGLTSEATGTDVEDSVVSIPVEGTAVVRDEDGNDVSKEFNVKVDNGSLTINKATVTLQSANLSKPYDGEPLVNGDTALAVETGWAEGEGATYTFTGSQTLVGNSANAFTYNPKSNTDLSNYTIQKTEGQLTVTSREAKYEVTVKANSGSKTYDGKELRVSGFKNEVADKGIKVEAENGKTYYVTGLTSEATGTDVEDSVVSIPVEGTAVVRDEDGNDVSKEFNVKVDNGSLTINKATVTLQSANLSKPYDGEPLVNGDTALAVETGWAEGEGATYTFTGSQTLVGNSANAFTYNPKSNTDLSNYTIQKTEGQLTVTSREAKYEVTVKANSGSKTYDGKELRVSGFKNEVADKGIKVEAENGKTYYVTGLTSEATGTDVEDSVVSIPVEGTAVVRDEDGNDVSKEFNVKVDNGSLTITPAKVTITVANDSKIYGQADPEFAEPDVVGLVNAKDLGEITVIRTNSEVETVGNYQDVLDAQYTPNPNYTVEVIKGDFEIKAQSINPSDPSHLNVKVSKPENKVYDGKDHKWIPEVTLEDGTPLVEGTDYTVTYSTENFKDVQKIKVTIEGTGNYSGTVTRKYRITRKPIKVTTDSAIKVYDGSALTADGRVEGIVDGETYGFVITGTQTEVGSSENTYKIEWTGSAKEGNYTIDKDLGTLTVVPQSIDPEDPTKPEDPDQPVYAGITVDKPEDKVYDGQEHKWTPTVTLSDGTVLDPENYEVSYDTEDFVNVTGKITVTITGTGNYAGTVTREYQITPRAITITSADDSKVYDGTPLTNGNVSVTKGSLVSEEDITFKATGSQTEVGSSANTIEVTYANEQMEKNYDVTLVEGTLTVTEKPAEKPEDSDSDQDSEKTDGEDTAAATNVGIFASLATSALAGMGILAALKKRRKD